MAIHSSNKDFFWNINICLTPGYRWAIRKLNYKLVSLEVISLISLMVGLVSACYYATGLYYCSIVGALFLLIKNYAGNIYNHIEEETERVTKFGIFLNFFSDTIVLFFLYTSIAISLNDANSFLLAYTAMLSAFFQCSVFKFYVASHKTILHGKNRTHVSINMEKTKAEKKLFLYQWLYLWINGWQCKAIETIDSNCLKIYRLRVGESTEKFIIPSWYGDKRFLALLSPLHYSTQILLLAICTVTKNVEGYLIFMSTGANIYMIALITFKTLFK